jgi:Leucine-rich repeat (LRR) protein
MMEQKEEQCCMSVEKHHETSTELINGFTCTSNYCKELIKNSLDLSAKELTNFPTEILNFSQVTRLFLDHNDIETIPDSR